MEFEFRCGECGEVHHGSPSFSYPWPPQVDSIPDEEQDARVFLTTDLCVIDDEEFYIRALLEIPIHGVEDPFLWGIWVTQSEENFFRYQETYDDDQTGDGGFGWLPVTMPGYHIAGDAESYEMLGSDVYWQKQGERPIVVPHACDHPLYHDVKNGISRERAEELAALAMHDINEHDA